MGPVVYLRARYERHRRDLSLKQVAALSKLTTYEISLIESGRLRPTTAQLAKLATAYGLPADELLKQVADVVTLTDSETRA